MKQEDRDAKASLGHTAADHRRDRSKEDGEGKMNLAQKGAKGCSRSKQQDPAAQICQKLPGSFRKNKPGVPVPSHDCTRQAAQDMG